MDAELWKQVKDIFSEIVDLPPSERKNKLDVACNGNNDLRVEIVALLSANGEVENFIEAPAFAVPDALPIDTGSAENKLIGQYRIVREIGRGGMGTVFLATRADGEFQQEVAIKVVSSAFLGRESIRRFRQERQILAGLNHPNIARLLDGGVTDDGLPYLVMEYVAGDLLNDHAEKHDLSLDDRLRIFLKICRAFAYAHGNLIVHLDIKPSNILVTPGGEPKLLDFGLAKIADIENNAFRTSTAFRALTPAYASPEQLRGEPISTASDVYSLGVVLYELLTGCRPFGSEPMPFEKMIHEASTVEPEKPSLKVLNTSTGRDRLTIKRHQSLKGDIDNIVLMAMRKEPARRYRSVEQMAEDIDRHLRGLPIRASEDTFAYRSSKFIKRHWIGVGSVLMIGMILIAGIITTTWQARVASRAQERSEKMNAFLQSILSSAAPEAKGADVKVRDVLAEASNRARLELADDPAALAKILLALGRTYVSLILYSNAETALRDAVTLSEKANGPDHPVTGSSLAWLGMALAYQAKFEEGSAVSERAVKIARNGSGSNEDLGYALFGYSANVMQKGDAAGALAASTEASVLIGLALGEQHGYYLATLNQTALAHEALGQLDEAELIFRQTIARGEGLDPRFRIYIAQAAGFLGRILIVKERYGEAETCLDQAEEVYRDVLGDPNPNIAYLKQMSGKMHILTGDLDKASKDLQTSVDIFSATRRPDNPLLLQSKAALGLALVKRGRLDVAETQLRDAKTAAGTLPPENELRIEIDSAFGECLTAQKKFAEAEFLLLSVRSALQNQARLAKQSFENEKRLSHLYKKWNRPPDKPR